MAAEDWVEAYRNRCAEFERLVFPVLDSDRRTRARRLFGDVETLSGLEPALLHADPDHLLVRDGRLVAVIDWGDTRIGDPALDHACFSTARSQTGKSIPTSGAELGSTTGLRPWYEAHYGLFTNQPAHIERGVAGINDRL